MRGFQTLLISIRTATSLSRKQLSHTDQELRPFEVEIPQLEIWLKEIARDKQEYIFIQYSL